MGKDMSLQIEFGCRGDDHNNSVAAGGLFANGVGAREKSFDENNNGCARSSFMKSFVKKDQLQIREEKRIRNQKRPIKVIMGFLASL